jgi:hypothetical protein
MSHKIRKSDFSWMRNKYKAFSPEELSPIQPYASMPQISPLLLLPHPNHIKTPKSMSEEVSMPDTTMLCPC